MHVAKELYKVQLVAVVDSCFIVEGEVHQKSGGILL